MAIGRRGVVFTIMAIVVASVIVLMTFATVQEKRPGIDTEMVRIRVVDGVAHAFSDYAQNVLRVATRAALADATTTLVEAENVTCYFSDDATFFGNLSSCLFGDDITVMREMSLPCQSAPVPCSRNSSVPLLLQQYQAVVFNAFNIWVAFDIDKGSLNITEKLPFEMRIAFIFNYTVNDPIASWSVINETVEVVVPLEGVKDPVIAKFIRGEGGSKQYFKATGGVGNYTFERDRTKEHEWNVGKLVNMTLAHRYRWAKGLAPSALMRYYGDFSPSLCCGVETMIDKNTLYTNRFTDEWNLSVVDHELFESEDPDMFVHTPFMCDGDAGPFAYAIRGDAVDPHFSATMFRLNSSVLGRYNVSGEYWNTTCNP